MRLVALYFDRLALFFAPRFVFFYHFAIAVTITAERHAEAFKNAGADILFLMDRKNVDAVFAKDQDVLEGLLAVHFELDTKDVLHHVKAGRVVVAWIAAKTHSVK